MLYSVLLFVLVTFKTLLVWIRAYMACDPFELRQIIFHLYFISFKITVGRRVVTIDEQHNDNKYYLIE